MESWRSGGPVRHWAVCDTATDRIAGGVEVRDLGDSEVNLSYVVFPSFRRAGVATQAARVALRYAAELGATTAVIKVLEGNDASIGVARRLGAVESGTERSDAGGTFIVFGFDSTITATEGSADRLAALFDRRTLRPRCRPPPEA